MEQSNEQANLIQSSKRFATASTIYGRRFIALTLRLSNTDSFFRHHSLQSRWNKQLTIQLHNNNYIWIYGDREAAT